MKKLRVTLNGKVYDLTVEVLEDDEQYVTGSNMPSPLPPPPASRRKSVEAPLPPAPGRDGGAGAASGKVDPDTILAPIAGTVQKVFVAGRHPRRGEDPRGDARRHEDGHLHLRAAQR